MAVIAVMTVVETALFAFIPLMLGRSIDGLLAGDWSAFHEFLLLIAALPPLAIARGIYDARAYGRMRVALGTAQALMSADEPLSTVNARILMGRELVDFLEIQAPESITALVQMIIATAVLLSLSAVLAASTGGVTLAIIVIYLMFSQRFFRLNASLNEQNEGQISALEHGGIRNITAHFLGLKKYEVRMSDTESILYGVIFLVLLGMLAFNLWFAATQSGATPGQIFSIVSYSYEFVQSAFFLPLALQALTRLREITQRINGGA